MEAVMSRSPIKRETKIVGSTSQINFGWKLRLCLFLIKTLFMISVIILSSFLIHRASLDVAEVVVKKADSFYTATLEQLPKSLVPPEFTITSKFTYTIEEAIQKVSAEQRVPASALAAMIEQESSNGKFLTSGLEEKTYNRIKKSHSQLPDAELRQLARSHGIAHVMGITALEVCEMSYLDLYDNYKGLTCAAKYLRIQLDKNKGVPIKEKLWRAFKQYNGTGIAAEVHADKVYALMEKNMMANLSKELR